MSARQIKSLVMPKQGYGHREHRSRGGRCLASIESRVDHFGKLDLRWSEEKNSRRMFVAVKNTIIYRTLIPLLEIGKIVSIYYEENIYKTKVARSIYSLNIN